MRPLGQHVPRGQPDRRHLTGANLRDCDLEKCELVRAKLADADLRHAKIAGLNVLSLGSIKGLKVSQDQQWLLLAGLGIEVHPD